MTDTTPERHAIADGLAVLAAALVALLGLALVFGSREPAIIFHGVLLTAGAVLGGMAVMGMLGQSKPADQDEYQDGPIKVATIAAVVWGIAGFLVGDLLAWQMAFPALNFDLPWLSFGRLRPLHTSAVIFAFGGNVLIGTSLYVVQRTSHARLAGRWAPWFVVWGYQLFIAIAGTGYLLGVRSGTPTSS